MPRGAPSHRPHSSTAPKHQLPRESAAARGYGHRWRKLRLMVLARQPICATPGCGADSTDVDHRISKARGGDDSFDNLIAYCHSCHSKKTAAEDGSFGRPIGDSLSHH